MLNKIGIAFLFFALHVSAQFNKDTLNRFSDAKKKTGYWLVFLNDKLIPVKDSSQAYFYAYNYYDNGVKAGFFPIANSSRRKSVRVDYHGLSPVKGRPQLLNGHITFFDKDSISMDEVYLNGIPVSRQGFFWDKIKKCKYKQTLDYNHAYKKETGSFYYEYFNYEDSIKNFNDVALIEKIWYRKKLKTWKLHYDKPKRGEEYYGGLVRYNILPLDRNGKGTSLINLVRRSPRVRFDLGFDRTYIKNQWLSGMYLDCFVKGDGRGCAGFNYNVSFTNSPKNYGYGTEKRVILYESNLVVHFLIIYKKLIKSTVFLNFGDSYFTLNYKKNDGRTAFLDNDFVNLKPGLWTVLNLRGLQINMQLYYRFVFEGKKQFGTKQDFNGIGYSIGFSLK